MKQQTYLKVSGFIFLIVAIVHAWRILNGLALTFGHTSVPVWFSWVGLLVAGYLAFQGLKKTRG